MSSEVSVPQQLNQLVEKQTNDAAAAVEARGPDVLSRYIEERRTDYYAWQLIQFFAQHPFMRFNRLAVIHALSQDSRRRFILEALEELIGQGIVKANNEGSSVLYSLAEDMRRLVLKLTRPE